ncbi:hypothetical protein ACHAXR_001793 [Thalassiosira sp. AJA248-18]
MELLSRVTAMMFILISALLLTHHPTVYATSTKTLPSSYSCSIRRQPAFVVSTPDNHHHRPNNNYRFCNGNPTTTTTTTISFMGSSSRNSNSSIGQNIIISQLQLAQTSTVNTQPVDQLADDDLVALPYDGYIASTTLSTAEATTDTNMQLRLCVIRNQEYIVPLIRHEDDVETDLFLDPRCLEMEIRLSDLVEYWLNIGQQQTIIDNDDGDSDDLTTSTTTSQQVPYYGVGWYGQRPVPSLGGGPGYGAEADEVWSIDENVLEELMDEGMVEIPVIDVGMAHGEKARGGALF